MCKLTVNSKMIEAFNCDIMKQPFAEMQIFIRHNGLMYAYRIFQEKKCLEAWKSRSHRGLERRDMPSILCHQEKTLPSKATCKSLHENIDNVITPIFLYDSEVWGPITYIDQPKWESSPTEILHLEFCKRLLQVHLNAPNNACRADIPYCLQCRNAYGITQ